MKLTKVLLVSTVSGICLTAGGGGAEDSKVQQPTSPIGASAKPTPKCLWDSVSLELYHTPGRTDERPKATIKPGQVLVAETEIVDEYFVTGPISGWWIKYRFTLPERKVDGWSVATAIGVEHMCADQRAVVTPD